MYLCIHVYVYVYMYVYTYIYIHYKHTLFFVYSFILVFVVLTCVFPRMKHNPTNTTLLPWELSEAHNILHITTISFEGLSSPKRGMKVV